MDPHGHGHYLTYIQQHCRCNDCRTAWKVYAQHNKLRHHRGETVSIDRTLVRNHILDLQHRYGATIAAISRAAGYSNNTTVRSALDPTKTRPVPAAAAHRILAVTFDTIPDDALVSGELATEQLRRLRQRNITNGAIARRLGWTGWPGNSWPGTRVQAGLVRTLTTFADEVTWHCEDCGEPAWSRGRWCWTHFKQRSEPPSETGCGTDAGYTRHRRDGTEPCRACRAAHAAANAHRSS